MERKHETIIVETAAEAVESIARRTSEWRRRHAGHDVVPADTTDLREDGRDILRLLFCMDCKEEFRIGLVPL